jgi:uncharacterized protein (TIGR00369 family)
MTSTSTSEAAIARLNSFPPAGASILLGTAPVEIDPARGFARIAYQGRAEFCNQHGMILGGFLAAMMDEAMAIAATASRGFGYVVPTLSMQTSYLQPVQPGPLAAEGQVRLCADRVVYLEGRLFNTRGDLAATATATARFRKAPWL